MALGFAKDIRPLFRDDPDVAAMKDFGIDLSSYDDVKTHAKSIHATLVEGRMPCDGAWPEDHVNLFQKWMDEGMAP